MSFQRVLVIVIAVFGLFGSVMMPALASVYISHEILATDPPVLLAAAFAIMLVPLLFGMGFSLPFTSYIPATRDIGIIDRIETGFRWFKRHWKATVGLIILLRVSLTLLEKAIMALTDKGSGLALFLTFRFGAIFVLIGTFLILVDSDESEVPSPFR